MAELNKIEDVKRVLGYGARKNLWKLEITVPAALGGVVTSGEINLLCKTCTLPGTRNLSVIPIVYKGETFNLAGEKEAYEPGFKVVFDNPQSFAQRNLLELWVNIIQQDFTSLRTSPAVYKGAALISQLDNTLEVIRKYKLNGIFPKGVNNNELSASDGGLIETSVDFATDTFELVAI